MFPIRDHNPSGRVPYVTYALMAVNIGIFLSMLPIAGDERALSQFYYDWALLPRRITEGDGYSGLITSQFLHGGWMHLAGNMLFLWIFGDNIEDEMGHMPYLGFYLFTGVISGLAHVVSSDRRGIWRNCGRDGGISAALSKGQDRYPADPCDFLSNIPDPSVGHAHPMVCHAVHRRHRISPRRRRRSLLGPCRWLHSRCDTHPAHLAPPWRHAIAAQQNCARHCLLG